jgi:hypothetical protein
MKLESDMWQVTSDENRRPSRAIHSRHPSPVTCHSQRAVALIITVILLSLLTLMALAFLTMSQRERGAVTTTTDTASARLAADAALASAEAQIVANVLATTNPYNFGLIVSTNYLPPVTALYPDYLTNLWIDPRAPVYLTNLVFQTNENRFYLDLNHNGVDDPNGWVTNVDNLGHVILDASGNPSTNFEVGDPEWIGVLQRPDQPYGPNNPFVARFAFIAVPVGNALDLNAIHNQAHRGLPSLPTSSTVNPPAGQANSYDDIFIRNEGVGSWEINLAAFLADLNTDEWGQVIGNTTYYYYHYLPYINRGYAFDDARALLAYRYNNDFSTLYSAQNLFPANGQTAFEYDNIDGFTYGSPLMIGFQLPGENDLALINNKAPWVGADNTNHFFTHQELFDSTKIQNPYAPALGFTDRLLNAGTNQWGGTTVPTYDRYTFYRLLSQLGTDSAPEQNKINLNYRNVTNGVVVPNLETNFYPWTAIEFFTNAADKMLRAYTTQWRNSNPTNFATTFYSVTNFNFVNPDQWANYPAFGITNIPVLVSNQFVYSSAIQRVLQLAANIYDATTNNTAALGTNFPSVFRPTFWVTNENGYTNVYINGYQQVVSVLGTNDTQLALPLPVTSLLPGVNYYTYGVNVYGVPWIIGAKKGFPNFNQFSMESIVGITRRLQVTRPIINPPSGAPDFANFHTNQMYTMCISNWLGVECWNSYTNNYVPVSVSELTIVVNDNLSMVLTNDDGMVNPPTDNLPLDHSTFINTGTSPPYWPGSAPWSTDGYPANISFDIPLLTNVVMSLNPSLNPVGYPTADTNWWVYSFDYHYFVPAPSTPLFETGVSGFPFPHFGLLTTNRLQVFMLDGNHVIDYAHFAGPDSARDLNAEIFNDQDNTVPQSDVWITNASTVGVPIGIDNQIRISRGQIGVNINDDGTWHGDAEAVTYGTTTPAQQAFFDGFFKSGNVGRAPPMPPYSGATATNLATTNGVEAPYEPTRYVVLYTTWQANDPLVHYIASDLNYTEETGTPHPGTNTFNYGQTIPILPNLYPGLTGLTNKLNRHYQPWGGSPYQHPNTTPDWNMALKDPLVWRSDNWDFPTNKLPTGGWLGRVHRGTPWQTVYLKSPDILKEIQIIGNTTNYIGTNTWMTRTGNGNTNDAVNTAPVQDRLLFDLFTTAFNDNATRGQLSVNVEAGNPSPQAGLAAWSALFSGVIALSNNAADPFLVPPVVQHNGSLINFTAFPINPAGPGGVGSALGRVVVGINQTRTNANNTDLIFNRTVSGITTNEIEIPATFANADGLVGAFEHVGDILGVPQLSDQSPFLNLSTNGVVDGTQLQNGISDEMYEWLPQQVMSLLRCSSSPRYVIYCYGQALKPAQNSLVTSGQFFGMVTNYQVVAEAATRAVVRFGSTLTNVVTSANDPISGNPIWFAVPVVTNNNVVIERFNVLPPD